MFINLYLNVILDITVYNVPSRLNTNISSLPAHYLWLFNTTNRQGSFHMAQDQTVQLEKKNRVPSNA